LTANDDYIVEILENVGLIDRSQAEAALSSAQAEEQAVIDILVRDGVADKLDILKALANQFGMEIIDDGQHADGGDQRSARR
jgi:hypothetical protein